MMLSIVIPVHNAHEFLGQTLLSLVATTHFDFELILIDDFSKEETRKYVQGVEILAPGITVRKIFNSEHKWTNYCWNIGASEANGVYVAILNSDIILSQGWDKILMKGLKTATISCPYEDGRRLDPVIEKVAPNMIKGACFMFKKSDVHKLFPIPAEIKHWCGDNWLADRAERWGKVVFCPDAKIKHFISQSAATVPKEEFRVRILEDLDAYEKISGRDMSLIRSMLSSHASSAQKAVKDSLS